MGMQLEITIFIGALFFFNNSIQLQEDRVSLIADIEKSFQNILQSPSTIRKKGLSGQKDRIKSNLIKKLQHPEFQKSQMILIEDEFEKRFYLIRNKKQELQKAYQNNIILQSYINNIIYKYSYLLPFTLPDIKKQIKNIEEGVSSNNFIDKEELLRYYMESIKNMIGTLLQRYLSFWLFFKKFFIEDEKISEYLYTNLCQNDISAESHSINKSEMFSAWIDEHNISNIINLNTEIPHPYILNSFSNPNKTRFFYISNKLELKKYEDDFFEKNFSEIRKNSICYNISILQLYNEATLNIPAHVSYIYKCMEAYFNGKETYKEVCKLLPNIIIKLYDNFKIYFYYQNRILRKKILPEILDMCYNKCFCGNYNIDCRNQDGVNDLDEGYIVDSLIKLFKNENETFLMKLNNLIEGINTLSYNKEIEKKCNSIQEIKQVLDRINSNNDFISNYKKLHNEWNIIRKSDTKERGNIINKLLDVTNNIEKLKVNFNKLALRNKFLQIFKNEKDVVCKFIIFTEIFSKIGYDNAINISYYDLIKYISNKEEKEQFTGFVIYKITSLTNTIKYNDKELRFLNLSFDSPKNLANVSDSLNTLSEWLYGGKSTSLFNYYAGLLTFLDYYIFFLNKSSLIEKYMTGKTSNFSDCLLNKKDLLSCVTSKLEKNNKPYLKILKKFFTKRKIYSINTKNLRGILHKLNPRGTSNKLYEYINEAVECCEKSSSKDNVICGDNNGCSIKYQSLTYIRRKGEERLKSILGTKLFEFLQKEIKNY